MEALTGFSQFPGGLHWGQSGHVLREASRPGKAAESTFHGAGGSGEPPVACVQLVGQSSGPISLTFPNTWQCDMLTSGEAG